MTNDYDIEDDHKLEHYRALLRARYYDKDGKEAVLQKEVHITAQDIEGARLHFEAYPKIEPSQEDWDVSCIEHL